MSGTEPARPTPTAIAATSQTRVISNLPGLRGSNMIAQPTQDVTPNGRRSLVRGILRASQRFQRTAMTSLLSNQRPALAVVAGIILWGASVALVLGQAPPATQMSDQVFKNVQILNGIPVDEFMGTMGLFSAALTVCCGDCHTGAGTSNPKWEDDPPKKRTARRMMQ